MAAPGMMLRKAERDAGGAERPNGYFSPSHLLAIVLAGSLGALILTGLVVSQTGEALDQSIFAAIRTAGPFAPANAPPWVNEAVRDMTAVGGTVVLTSAVVAAFLYLMASARPRLALLLAGSAIGATVLSTVLKQLIERARPDLAGHLVHVHNPSFPSGHTLLSAAIILTLGGLIAYAARRRWQKRIVLWTAALLCIGVGLSRIWLGVHWPSDVLAGWLIGSAWAAGTLLLAMGLARPGAAAPTEAGAESTGVHRPAPSARSAAD